MMCFFIGNACQNADITLKEANMSETVNQEGTVNNANETVNQEKTFTQADVDRIVKERTYRAQEKYADYDELKEKAARLDALEEQSKTELQKATDKAARLQAELDGLKNAEKVRAMREKVSKETEVPMELLNGSTEEECKAQAEKIKAFANPSYPNLRDGGEPAGNPKATAEQQFAEWLNQN